MWQDPRIIFSSDLKKIANSRNSRKKFSIIRTFFLSHSRSEQFITKKIPDLFVKNVYFFLGNVPLSRGYRRSQRQLQPLAPRKESDRPRERPTFALLLFSRWVDYIRGHSITTWIRRGEWGIIRKSTEGHVTKGR